MSERRLLFREKQEMERLIKCERERKRAYIINELLHEKEKVVKPFNEKIKEIEKRRDEMVKLGLLDNITNSCGGIYHPKLAEFDAETNRLLKELWDKRD